MVVVSLGSVAVVLTAIIAKLRGGKLPERILARMNVRPNEWRENLVLRVAADSELLVATSRRKLRKLKLDTAEVSEVKIWRLEAERCPRGVCAGEIVDWARDTGQGEFDPSEVPQLLAEIDKDAVPLKRVFGKKSNAFVPKRGDAAAVPVVAPLADAAVQPSHQFLRP